MQRYHLVTLGCPKNEVDSDKVEGTLLADGMSAVDDAGDADLIVVNTCAFIESARQESIDTILALDDQRREGAKLVVTGCMAERYGSELADVLPEVDSVAGFGVPVNSTVSSAAVPVSLGPTRGSKSAERPIPVFDLLNLPRAASSRPWAYVKIAEGCDRKCGFCAIPSFRGAQRSRSIDDIVAEVEQLGAREVILVAQDLASFGNDTGNRGGIVSLVRTVSDTVDRVRLLYLYPSDLTDPLVDAIVDSGVVYFDLSLQHVSSSLLRRMRRWGNGQKFLSRIEAIRRLAPDAAFRSNFIVGYPGETEDDHAELLEFVEAAQLDWCGFFSYSRESGTYAADLDGVVAPELMAERLTELTEIQDRITTERRAALIGSTIEVLVDDAGIGRSHREAPEIDGIVNLPGDLEVGELHLVRVTDSAGPDLVADRV
ncbi:MAG: 30S ribosomal protein S12 methylthiotransferase RimO [Actinomycetia bacterium]|nr:30S ribosomal protein S12 methylthiotransferase RimO [Actinomycetes bacterium]MCP4961360.1 30S ribosomal protein S12 methylthiotransferase RimO [Actinomycetes bacterium]